MALLQTSHETEITIDSYLTVWPYTILLKLEGYTPTGTSTWQKQIQSSWTTRKIVLLTRGESYITFTRKGPVLPKCYKSFIDKQIAKLCQKENGTHRIPNGSTTQRQLTSLQTSSLAMLEWSTQQRGSLLRLQSVLRTNYDQFIIATTIIRAVRNTSTFSF